MKYLLTLGMVLLLLWGCSGSQTGSAETKWQGLTLRLNLVTNDPGSASKLLDQIVERLASDDQLNAENPAAAISRLNREDNNKSVGFSAEAYDFLLNILSLGRTTRGLIELQRAPLRRIWNLPKGVTQEPNPADIDSALAQCRRSGFISASNSFLVYGPAATWDLTPFQAAWYLELATEVLRDKKQNALLQVGPLYRVIRSGDAPEQSWPVKIPEPCNAAGSGRQMRISKGTLAVVPCENFRVGETEYCQFVNPLTGRPGTSCITAVVQGDKAVDCLGLAVASLLQPPEKALEMVEQSAGVSAILLHPDGEAEGAEQLIKLLD